MNEKIKIECDNLDLISELNDFILFLEENRKSQKTISNYSSWINDFFKFILGNKKISACTYEKDKIVIQRFRLTATRYQDYLIRKGQAHSTVNLKTIALNSFLQFLDLTEENKRGKNVVIKLQTLEVEAKHSIEDDKLMQLDDFIALTNEAKECNDKRAVALFQFLLNTGARISEALSVDIEGINKVGATSYKVNIIGKRGKPRAIDFDRDTYTAIKDYLYSTGRTFKDTGALFISVKKRDGIYKRLVPSTADFIIKQYAKKTGLPVSKFFAHNFRHLIAKTLLDEGATLDKVKNFLGHSNISTTAIYTMGKASELRDLKETALKSAKTRLINKKYKGYEFLLEHLNKFPDLSDLKLASLLGMKKSTFSRKYAHITKEMRKDLTS